MSLTGDRWSTTPFWRLFGIVFLLLFALSAIWSVGSPLLSGPDEPTHVVKSAGVIRGQFVGTCINNPYRLPDVCSKNSPFTEVKLPAFFALLRNSGQIPGTSIPGHGVACDARRVNVPASCTIYAKPSQYKNLVSEAWIYDGRYPPLYYAIVGIPSLFGKGLWVLYLMRLFAAGASAAFVALGVVSILRWSSNRLLLLGVLVAGTPMVFYLTAVLNPSGLETASALCLWTVGVIIFGEHNGRPPLPLIVIAGLSASVLESTRGLSPLWLAITAVVLVSSARLDLLKNLISNRAVQVTLVIVFLFGVLATVWIVYEHATVLDVASKNAQALIPSPSTSELTILRTSFHHNIYYLPGMVAIFGDFDTYAPLITFVIWYGLGGLLFLAGLGAARNKLRAVIVLFGLGIVVVPVLISSSQARHIGYVWAGRDTLPFAVGLPMVCAMAFGQSRIAPLVRKCTPAILVFAGVAQLAAFFWLLKRYTVGENGPSISFLWHSPWSPPVLGALGALVAEGVLLVCAYGLLLAALGYHPLGGPRRPSLEEIHERQSDLSLVGHYGD